MKRSDTKENEPVSRRSFLGVAVATLGVGIATVPDGFAESATRVIDSDSQYPASSGPENKKTASPHITSLIKKTPHFTSGFGSLTHVNADDLHILNRLSIRRLILSQRGVREPHWHPNAHELGYCLRGKHLITIASNQSSRNSFVISKGEMFFVPSGALHHIENIGTEEGEIIIGFSHERPEDFGLSGTFGCFTDAVLGNTLGVPAAALANMKKTSQDTTLGGRDTDAIIERQERETNPYKYSLEAIPPRINSAVGSAHTASSLVWPELQNLAMFSVDLNSQGMREIHWHPETAEMGYVAAGKGRMTIVSPGGVADTYEMTAGDVYFIPRGYPHHIEDLGKGDLRLLVFFDQSIPGDIGVKTAVSCFSREVLAATFKVAPSAFPEFPFTDRDPLFVPRINPVDPVEE